MTNLQHSTWPLILGSTQHQGRGLSEAKSHAASGPHKSGKREGLRSRGPGCGIPSGQGSGTLAQAGTPAEERVLSCVLGNASRGLLATQSHVAAAPLEAGGTALSAVPERREGQVLEAQGCSPRTEPRSALVGVQAGGRPPRLTPSPW